MISCVDLNPHQFKSFSYFISIPFLVLFSMTYNYAAYTFNLLTLTCYVNIRLFFFWDNPKTEYRNENDHKHHELHIIKNNLRRKMNQ